MNLSRHDHLTSATSVTPRDVAVTGPGHRLRPAPPDTRDAIDAGEGLRSSRLRGLHPGWFGGVMGTGILALAAYQNPGGSAALLGTAHAVGEVLAVITVLLAAALVSRLHRPLGRALRRGPCRPAVTPSSARCTDSSQAG